MGLLSVCKSEARVQTYGQVKSLQARPIKCVNMAQVSQKSHSWITIKLKAFESATILLLDDKTNLDQFFYLSYGSCLAKL